MKKGSLYIMYIIGFIFALRSALPSYMGSSFLDSLINEKNTGLFFALCSFVTIFGFLYISKVLRKFGNYRTAVFLSVINLISLSGLAIFNDIYGILICYLVNYVTGFLIILCTDIFIEHNTANRETGRVRSYYLTALNIAWLISPWLSGLIIGKGDYWKVYLISSYIMAVVVFLIYAYLGNFKDDKYKEFKFISTMREVWKKKDIKNILMSNFLLNCFYCWMTIYTPIYLYKYVNLNWTQIGIIFTIMLLPFVCLQIPLGRIADKYFGEKELLSIGYIIIAVSVFFIPFMAGKSILIWAILLFWTRVGAATVEVMNETYFFKKICDKDINLIGLYRSIGVISYIITPIVAVLIMSFVSFLYSFFALALLMLFGLKYSLRLKDIK